MQSGLLRSVSRPRPAVSRAGYIAAVGTAVDKLVADRLLLNGTGGVDDVAAYKNRATMPCLLANFMTLP